MTHGLTRTMQVLDRVLNSEVTFTRAAEPDELPSATVTITRAVWRDMGEPDTITVTIEPGDRLNN